MTTILTCWPVKFSAPASNAFFSQEERCRNDLSGVKHWRQLCGMIGYASMEDWVSSSEMAYIMCKSKSIELCSVGEKSQCLSDQLSRYRTGLGG